MKNVFVWLEDLKKNLSFEIDQEALKADLKVFNERLSKVKDFNDFSALEKEVIEKGTMTFATSIDGKTCVFKEFKILVHNAGESKFSIDHAMSQLNPEDVIRYSIYDYKVIRIRTRMCDVNSLKKSLKLVPHDLTYYKKYVEEIISQLTAKLNEATSRTNDDKYKNSMVERTNKLLERAKALLS
jgi:hypothetical protein